MNLSDMLNPERVTDFQRFVEEHLGRLERIEEAIRDDPRPQTQVHKRLTSEQDVVSLPGTTLQIARTRVRSGYNWLIERVAVALSGQVAIGMFRDLVAPSAMLELVNSANLVGFGALSGFFFYTDAFDNNLFLPGDSEFLIVTNNVTFTADLQIKETPSRESRHIPSVPYGEV